MKSKLVVGAAIVALTSAIFPGIPAVSAAATKTCSVAGRVTPVAPRWKSITMDDDWRAITADPRDVNRLYVWELQPGPSYIADRFRDPREDYTARYDLLRSDDGGCTWETIESDTTCPGNLEIPSLKSRNDMYQLCITGTDPILIRKSEDGGRTWSDISLEGLPHDSDDWILSLCKLNAQAAATLYLFCPAAADRRDQELKYLRRECVPPGHLYEQSTIFRYNGKSWDLRDGRVFAESERPSSPCSSITVDFYSQVKVNPYDADDIWLWWTAVQYEKFNLQYLNPEQPEPFRLVSRQSFMSGIARSTDGGRTLKRVNLPIPAQAVQQVGSHGGSSAQNYIDVLFRRGGPTSIASWLVIRREDPDSDSGYEDINSGVGNLLLSKDGGATWSITDLSETLSKRVLYVQQLFFASDGTVLLRTEGEDPKVAFWRQDLRTETWINLLPSSVTSFGHTQVVGTPLRGLYAIDSRGLLQYRGAIRASR